MTNPVRTALFGGWLLLIGVGVGGAIVPEAREGRRLERELAEKRLEAARPVGGHDVVTRLTDKITELRAHSSDRIRTIPVSSNIADLMGELAQELNRLELADREVTTGTAQTLDEAESMPMSVRVSGPFPRVFEAMRYIESLDRLVRVQKFRAATDRTGRSSASRTGAVEAELLIDVFYAPRTVAQEKGGR